MQFVSYEIERLIGQAENGPSGLYCFRRPVGLVPPTSMSKDYRVGETRSLVQGDRVTSYPFTGEYRTWVPVVGNFDTEYTSSDGDPFDVRVCGNLVTARSYQDFETVVPDYFVPKPPENVSTAQFVKDIADTKALADLRRSMINLPLLLAERKETIAYLKGKLFTLSNAVKRRQAEDVKRYFKTKFRDRKRVSKEIASEHLGFMFGFLPLIDEARGLAELLSKNETLTFTGRGRMADVKEVNSSFSNKPSSPFIISNPNQACYEGVMESYTRFSHRTSVTVNVDVEQAASLRDVGFNPIATLYDLVPLSFLSDFISNMGTFLRSLDPLLGVSFKTGSSTSWIEVKNSVKVKGSVSQANGSRGPMRLSSTGAGEGFYRLLHVKRTPLVDYPEARLLFVNNMSWGKAATALALSVQRWVKPINKLIALKPFRYRGPRPRYRPPIKYRRY